MGPGICISKFLGEADAADSDTTLGEQMISSKSPTD